MRMAIGIVSGVLALMAAVDIVYVFCIIVSDMKAEHERKMRKKYVKER